MSVDVVDGFGKRRFAFTPGFSPTGAKEGSVAPGVAASHSDQSMVVLGYMFFSSLNLCCEALC